ncbi:hypothetical protein [Streptomyces sp. NBC_01615]|uniref:hypothetical protein n=1 Tax=Streptomyces sp. NBC_01615 TaxID=2975898 RepID=UPI003869FD64
MSLIIHAAGRDHGLRLALEDLQLGRWFSTRDLLRATGTDWALRTSRSQVLATVAAQNDAIAAWCQEEPHLPDAVMMRARVLTQRVLNAHREGADGQHLISAIRAARQACSAAATSWPDDPVPWVCYLALVQLDVDPRFPHSARHWASPPEPMLPSGPWPLLNEANWRHPGGREAYHRMLAVFHARAAGGLDFARTVSAASPAGSELLLLPLYAYVESYRLRLAHQQSASVISFWSGEDKRHYARRALHGWFAHTNASTCSLLDLNYLAFALTATGVGGASEVFEAIGPHITTAPWAQVSGRSSWWQDDFLKARAGALRERTHHR